MKKLLSIILVVLMLTALLASCGTSVNTNTETDTNTESNVNTDNLNTVLYFFPEDNGNIFAELSNLLQIIMFFLFFFIK